MPLNRHRYLMLLAAALFACAGGSFAEQAPAGGASTGGDTAMELLWAPTRVGEGRRFRIVLRSEARPSCEHSDALTLLDSAHGVQPGEHRYYFRADAPAEAALVTFLGDSGTVVAEVRIIAERDWDAFEAVGEIELPRVWPLSGAGVGLKERHTLTDASEIGAGDASECPHCELSDEELWELVSPSDIPRWHFLNLDKGCPIHGLDIYHTDPYYPWLVEPADDAYHVRCPVGGELLPTNDYAAGDHTSGEYPDDGWGYQLYDEDGEGRPETFGIIAYSLLRRIRHYYSVAGALANHYRATGDAETAHKLSVLLVAIAREHRYLCYFPEHRFRRYEGVVEEEQYRQLDGEQQYGPLLTDEVQHLQRSGMDDYCINMPGQYETVAHAYDLVFDRIADDQRLVEFVSQRLPWLVDGRSIREFIETNLLRGGVQASLDHSTDSNLPRPQEALLTLIRAIDQPECKPLLDWLVHGQGQVARMPVNFYYKDGAAYESIGGYNGIHVTGMIPLADGLRELCAAYPELYPDSVYNVLAGTERFRHILAWPVEVVVAQVTPPLIGDTGSPPKGEVLDPQPTMGVGNPVETYEKAADYYPDEEMFASVVRILKAKRDPARRPQPDTTKGFYDSAPEAPVEFDPDLFHPSRLLDGYGVGILESGGAENRRGLWLYYGDHPGHSHEQAMDMGLVAHRRNLLRHMGYPFSWQHMGDWDANWLTHYSFKVINDPELWWRSTVRLFCGEGPFQAVEAAGYGITSRRTDDRIYAEVPGTGIRRMLCLVDLPDGAFYAVDMFRILGGDEHWRSFHGPPGDMTVNCPGLVDQGTGTAAGPEVEYGEDAPGTTPRSLSNLYDVKRSEAPGRWSATWALPDSDELKLRVTQLSPADGEIIFARGRSPHAPADNPPYELDWIVRHHTADGEALATEFVDLIEADANLPIASADMQRTGPATCVQVNLEGLTHYLLRSDAPGEEVTFGDLSFTGRVGFVEVDAGGELRRASLVGGGALTWRGKGVTAAAPDWTGEIVEVRLEDRAIAVAADQAPPEDMSGRYVLVNRGFEPRPDGDTFTYRVESVSPLGDGRWLLALNWSPVIGDGTADEVTEDGIVCEGQMPLGRARAYYRGAYLLNENRTQRFRVADVDGSWSGSETSRILVVQSDRTQLGSMAEGSRFTIEEIGAGDAVALTNTARVERRPDGRWELHGRADVDVE